MTIQIAIPVETCRRARGVIAFGLAILLPWQSVLAQESRPSLPPAPPPPGMSTSADDPDAMKVHVSLSIPQVIVPQEVERYCQMLGLSEDQRSAFERTYIKYREDCDKLNREQMPAIAHLSLTCAAKQLNDHDWTGLMSIRGSGAGRPAT